MAGAVTWSRLRELSSFRTTNGLALTLNLGLDPSTAAILPDTQATKINSLLDEAQKSAFAQRAELTHDQKLGLQSDFERVRSYLVNDVDRAGMRGIAVFTAALDGFWSVIALTEPIEDRVRVGPDFAIATLVPGPPAWTREFFARLAVVPLLQTAIAGLLLVRYGKRAKIE